MAQTINKVIEVQELTRYGVKVNNEYVNWSKNINPAQKAQVVPGASYEAEIYVADSGKEYINKINSKPGSEAITGSKPAKADTPKYKPSAPAGPPKNDGMSKDEWAAKDLRISRQGVIQAAVQAVAPLVSLELLHTEAVKLANQMLEFVNYKGDK